MLLKNHPLVANMDNHIMADFCVKDGQFLVVHSVRKSNLLFEEYLLVKHVVSHFMATMFCIICVQVCEISFWHSEMDQCDLNVDIYI